MHDGGVGGEVSDEHREAAETEPATPEVAEVDAVEPLEVRLYGVGVLDDERGERC